MESHVSHRQRLWLYIFVGLVIFYLIAPTLVVVPVSFNPTKALTFPPSGFSTRWYEAVLGQEKWLSAIWISLRVAFFTMILTTVIGIAAAYALHEASFRFVQTIRATLISPLAVPSILIAVGIFFVYAVTGGMLNTLHGLIVAHAVVAMPFVVLTMTSGFASYDMSQEMVARSLGASRLKAFVTVTLPQMKFSVITSLLLSFLVSFDELIIAMMVASGPHATLPRVTFATLRDDVDPSLAAISTLTLVTTSLPPLLLHIWQNRSKKKGVRNAG